MLWQKVQPNFFHARLSAEEAHLELDETMVQPQSTRFVPHPFGELSFPMASAHLLRLDNRRHTTSN